MPTNPQDLTTLVNLLIMAVVVLIFVLIISLTQIGVRAQRRFEQWKARELQGAKQYLRGNFATQMASQAGLAATLNTVYVFGLPKDYPEVFRSRIAAVTPEQVKSAAVALLGSDYSVIAIVGDYAKVKDQLTPFKDITFLDVDGKTIPPPQTP